MKEKFDSLKFITIVPFISIASGRDQLPKNKNDTISTWLTDMEKYQAYIQTYKQ